MIRSKLLFALLGVMIGFGLYACNTAMDNESSTTASHSENSFKKEKEDTPISSDSLSKNKEQVTILYSQAIAEFIRTVYKKDKTRFDTLFFGKHVYGQPDDFPDIELPEIIEHTPIKIISPELGKKLQRERKSLVYINMIGWIDPDRADFVFVVFFNGAQHQYDYYINYAYNTSIGNFELMKIEYENYSPDMNRKPNRMVLFPNEKGL